MKKYMIGGYALCFLYAVLCGDPVLAEKLGIAVDEQKVAFDMDVGEEQKVVLKVTNTSDSEQRVHVQAINYKLGDNNAVILEGESEDQYGIREWVTIEKNEIILPAHMGTDVEIVVRTPENASVGSHRGAILFRALTAQKDTTVSVQGQIGVHMLINVKGDTRAGGELRSFRAPFFSFGDTRYEATFFNNGNIHYIPHGELMVYNVITKKTFPYDMNAGDRFIFPDREVTFTLTQKIPSIFGMYKVFVRFVDGDGRMHTHERYMTGGLFPILSAVLIAICAFAIMKLKRIGRRRALDQKRLF